MSRIRISYPRTLLSILSLFLVIFCFSASSYADSSDEVECPDTEEKSLSCISKMSKMDRLKAMVKKRVKSLEVEVGYSRVIPEHAESIDALAVGIEGFVYLPLGMEGRLFFEGLFGGGETREEAWRMILEVTKEIKKDLGDVKGLDLKVYAMVNGARISEWEQIEEVDHGESHEVQELVRFRTGSVYTGVKSNYVHTVDVGDRAIKFIVTLGLGLGARIDTVELTEGTHFESLSRTGVAVRTDVGFIVQPLEELILKINYERQDSSADTSGSILEVSAKYIFENVWDKAKPFVKAKYGLENNRYKGSWNEELGAEEEIRFHAHVLSLLVGIEF